MRQLRFLVVLAVAAMPPAPAAAQNKSDACPGAVSTDDVVACIDRDTVQWDAQLNNRYRALMAGLDPERREPMREAQRRWIAFRDAECRFHARGPGTMARIEAAFCLRRLTEERARELERLAAAN